MNTYILQKDLPDVKAGAEFKMSKEVDAYFLISDKTGTKYNCYCYPKNFVENNPEWFKEEDFFGKLKNVIVEKDTIWFQFDSGDWRCLISEIKTFFTKKI